MMIVKKFIEEGTWIPTLSSTNIVQVRYLREQRFLIIQFKTGDFYRYENFPEVLAAEFINSPSKGKFFYAKIKQNFKWAKCDPDGNVAPLPQMREQIDEKK